MKDKLEDLLIEFGATCYWYGEDTGDYGCHQVFGSRCAKYTFKEIRDKILKLIKGGREMKSDQRPLAVQPIMTQITKDTSVSHCAQLNVDGALICKDLEKWIAKLNHRGLYYFMDVDTGKTFKIEEVL